MKQLIENFLKKYPVTFVSIILFAIVAVISYEKIGIGQYANNISNNLIMAITIMLISIIESSFLVPNILDVKNEKLPEKIKHSNLIKNLIGALFGIIIYFITSVIVSIYIGNGYDGQYVSYPVSFILISFSCFFIITKKNIDTAKYGQKVFINELLLLILYLVMITGTGVLFYISYVLFSFKDWTKMIDIALVEMILVTNIGFFISLENVDGETSGVAKILIKYVMFIMVLIGFVFFYIYLIKIIFTKSLPSNQVFLVCSILFIAGLPTALMSKSFDDGNIYDKIINYLPLAFIPAIILQIISITLRINQYGFTVMRYLGVSLIIFEIAYVVLYIFKYNKLKYIFIVGAIICFIMTYVPIINIMQFPEFYNTHFLMPGNN